MATKKAPKLPPDALDQFVDACKQDPTEAAIAILWKLRHQFPELAIQIGRKDLKGLNDCAGYLEVVPTLHIHRREAVPARAAQPPSAEYPKGVPGFAGAPASEYVTIGVVAHGTTDSFKPIENNEEDAQAGENAAALRTAIEQTPGLAQMVSNNAAQGIFSEELVMELAANAMALARAAARR